jgi:hypothetical protein
MKGFRGPVCLLAVAVTVLVSGCGKQSSTYADSKGILKIYFEPGGKAVMTVEGKSADCAYSNEGESIAVTCAGQTTVFNVEDDGSLDGAPSGTPTDHLTKQ